MEFKFFRALWLSLAEHLTLIMVHVQGCHYGWESKISPSDHEHDPHILLSETKRGMMNGEIRDLPRPSLEIPSPEENPSPKLSIKRKMQKETEGLVLKYNV